MVDSAAGARQNISSNQVRSLANGDLMRNGGLGIGEIMSLLDAVRSILGIKPVKVADIAAAVSPSSPARRSSGSTATNIVS